MVRLAWLIALAAAVQPALAGRDARLAELKAAVFDPLEGEPDLEATVLDGPVLRAERRGLRPATLLQLDEPVTRATDERLRAHGLERLGLLPPRTLVVRALPGAPPSAAEGVPGLRWSGAYAPAYKLAPDLARLVGGGSPEGTVALDVILFRGEDPHALAQAVRERFDVAQVVHVLDGALVRVALEVPRAVLAPLVGALVRDDAVEFVARRVFLVPHNDNGAWIGQTYDRVNGPLEAQAADPKPYPLSASVWNRGLTGAGQIVAVADTGLEHGTCFFEDPAHAVTPHTTAPPAPIPVDVAHRKLLAYNAPHASSLATDDTFRHGTHTSTSAVGDDLAHLAGPGTAGHDHGDGMAPAAKLIFEDVSGSVTSSCSTLIKVDSVLQLLEQEHASGARISSNSWGSAAGELAVDATSLEADAAGWAHEDLAVFVSAGNNGGGGLTGLATCKNCVSVGASENYDASWNDVFGILDPENMAAFSSRGPTADGRLKPDLVAPGFRVDSARFPVTYHPSVMDPACAPGNAGVCKPGFGGCYVTDTAETCYVDALLGTSQATPIVAGLATLARQYFTKGFYPTGQASPGDARVPSAALLKALLINGARNMTGHLYERRGTPVDLGPLADAPSPVQGWGRVELEDALYFAGDARRLWLAEVSNAAGLATGESIEVKLAVGAGEPFELTLVWTDPPAAPAAAAALVNDLDLTLAAPGGTLYRGNRFTPDVPGVAGDVESAANPANADSVNNVEGIRLKVPTAGLYTVTIHAADVPGDTLRQGAALVVTGAVAECTAQAPPVGLTAIATGGGRVDLTWQAVPGALGYRVLRNGTGCGAPMPADQLVAVPAGTTSFADLSVEPETTYHYTVRAIVSAEGCETKDGDCATATTRGPGPPPAVGLRASRANVAGSSIDLEWDASSCPAPGYHLLFGPLAAVAGPEPSGAVCDIGTLGTYAWQGVPPGKLWFLVVSDDGAATEGSWGTRSDGTARGDGEPSLACGLTLRDDSGDCP